MNRYDKVGLRLGSVVFCLCLGIGIGSAEEAAVAAGTVPESGVSMPEMVVIPAGSFRMGRAGGRADEQPVRTVPVDAFALSRHPVTRAQYAAFVEETGYRTEIDHEWGGCRTWHNETDRGDYEMDFLPGATWRDPGFSQGPDEPVVCLTLSDIQAYIDWLNEREEGRFRLPSEAEWEYAARAGSESLYFFDDDPEALCRYANLRDESFRDAEWEWTLPVAPCDDGYPLTSPVGALAANDWGLHDMLGNVEEWTADCWYPDYRDAPANARPRTYTDCDARVARGGSWYSRPEQVYTSSRRVVYDLPDAAYAMLGFRVASDVPDGDQVGNLREPPAGSPEFADHPVLAADCAGVDGATLDHLELLEGQAALRQRLQRALARLDGEPNFAACWKVLEVPCGTLCTDVFLVHAGSGRVLPGPTTLVGADFRLDSGLLIADPEPRLAEAFGDERPDYARDRPRYYRFDPGRATLERIDATASAAAASPGDGTPSRSGPAR